MSKADTTAKTTPKPRIVIEAFPKSHMAAILTVGQRYPLISCSTGMDAELGL
jgi:hypothetical protein